MNRSLYRSRDSFATVSWGLVKALGGDVAAASLFDWIAWKCESEYAPRDAEGTRWYSISYPSLSEMTGVSEKVIRTTIAKLVSAGHIQSTQLRAGGSYDQTRSYSPVWTEGVPCGAGPSAHGGGVPHRADGPAPQGGCDLPHRADVPLIRERKKEVKKDAASDAAVINAVIVDPFDEFWSEYPVKKGKKDAKVAYEKALKRSDPDTILAGVRAYKSSLGPSPDLSRVKWAQGWLNGDRWSDEYAGHPGGLTNAEKALADMHQRYGGDPRGASGDARTLGAVVSGR